MNTLLLSSIYGIVWLILLFCLCFLFVHVARLARLGQTYRKELKNVKPDEENTANKREQTPQKTEPEPIYYIVERKKRVKNSFSEPKQIRFK